MYQIPTITDPSYAKCVSLSRNTNVLVSWQEITNNNTVLYVVSERCQARCLALK